MIDLDECIIKLKSELTNQELSRKKIIDCYRERRYSELPDIVETSLRTASTIYLLNRELLVALYELMPSIPQPINVHRTCCEMLSVSVERLKDFSFPVYKIGLPFLLPNKRKRNAERNGVITDSVSVAVSWFCREHHITPFAYATVIFLSHYQNGSVTVDNDNLDSAVLINSLNGRFIRDDRPEVCNTMYYSKVSEKAITEIFVVDSDHDIEVLSLIKSTCHK